MPFKAFTIEAKDPGPTCNARMWENGQEVYCPMAADGKRCERHDMKEKHEQFIKEQIAGIIADSSSVKEKAEGLAEGEEADITQRLKHLTATLKILEERTPVTLDVAELIGKLTKIHGELSERKLNIEMKREMVSDLSNFWRGALVIIKELKIDEKLDKGTFQALVDGLLGLVKREKEKAERRLG